MIYPEFWEGISYEDHNAYERHWFDMAWMFTPAYGFHTQADLDANEDYHWSLANLIGFASA